ncbi:MAG: arabinose ABC transporter substrate-binding protein [Opitutaceae bacterium]|jgi:L-arabinose transport system substrate-binding protein
MKTRHIVASVLACTLAFLFSACSKSADSSAPQKIKIGFLVKQPEEPWFQFEWKGGDKAAAQHGFELIKIGVPDGEKTLAAIDSLAANGAQGFVICTPDVRLGPAIVAKAKVNGLKLITVDDRFIDADNHFLTDVPYLGMSATKIGELSGRTLAAEMMRRGWNPAETGACIVTFEELDTARSRTDGVISALKAAGFPEDHIYKTPQKTTDIPGSFDAANALLSRKTGVKNWIVAGMNDNAVLGAVRATEGVGFDADHVIGVGINGTDCLDELRKPAPTGFFGSIYVSAVTEGSATAEMLYLWITDGKQPAMLTVTEGQLITRENFQEILKGDGVL